MKDNSDVIVLGSGYSLGHLSRDEIEYINKAEIIFGLNKYIAFYKKLNILPSHVYFVDVHENSLRFMRYIFSFCAKEKIQNVHFILDQSIAHCTFQSRSEFYQKQTRYIFRSIKQNYNFINGFPRIIKRLLNLFFRTNWYVGNYFILPKDCTAEFVHRTPMLEPEGWAKSLDEPLFHFRTSFTSLLNYISIKYPGKTIRLVGTDFNKGEYFFQKELENLDIEWKDSLWEATKANDKHFAAQKFKGTTMMDKMDVVIENLRKSNNEIFCNNPNSLLVKHNFVPYSPLMKNQIRW
jgi:hypothetical protein